MTYISVITGIRKVSILVSSLTSGMRLTSPGAGGWQGDITDH